MGDGFKCRIVTSCHDPTIENRPAQPIGKVFPSGVQIWTTFQRRNLASSLVVYRHIAFSLLHFDGNVQRTDHFTGGAFVGFVATASPGRPCATQNARNQSRQAICRLFQFNGVCDEFEDLVAFVDRAATDRDQSFEDFLNLQRVPKLFVLCIFPEFKAL